MLQTSRHQEFLSERSVLFRPRSDRASYVFASNKFQLFDCKIKKPTPACRPDRATWTMFSVARGQVLRRIKSTALSLRPPLHSELTFPSFADKGGNFIHPMMHRFIDQGASCFGLRFRVLRFRNYPILSSVPTHVIRSVQQGRDS